MKKKTLILGAAIVLVLALTACGRRETVTKTTDSLTREEQPPAAQKEALPAAEADAAQEASTPAAEADAAQEADAPAAEADAAPARTVSGTMLLDRTETAVYLDISDTEINFWDSAAGGTLLAVARYPETLPGAADALRSWDTSDLDGDGSSELSAEFAFADGSTASLIWFYTDGGLVFNEEFSRLPGEPSAAGTD